MPETAASATCLVCARALDRRRPRGRKICSTRHCQRLYGYIIGGVRPACAACGVALDLAHRRDLVCTSLDCVRTLSTRRARSLCAYCNRPAASGTLLCGDRRCDRARELAAEVADGRRQLARRREELAARTGVAEPRRLPMARIPVNRRPIGPADPGQRASFRAHLEGLLQGDFDAVAAATADNGDELTQGLTGPTQQARELAMCTLCAGACCEPGGRLQALIDRPTLQRYQDAHPEADDEAIVAAYLAYVPTEHYTGSCIYHSPTGCALPRGIRGDICNKYLCRGLLDYRRSHAAGAVPDDVPTFVAATTTDAIIRDGLVYADGSLLRGEARPPERYGPVSDQLDPTA